MPFTCKSESWLNLPGQNSSICFPSITNNTTRFTPPTLNETAADIVSKTQEIILEYENIFTPYRLIYGVIQTYVVLIGIWIISKYIIKSIPKIQTGTEVLLGHLTLLLISPAVLTIISLLLITRFLVNSYLVLRYRGKVKILKGIDAFFAGNFCNQTNYMQMLFVVEGDCKLKDIQHRIANDFLAFTVDGKVVYDRWKRKIIQKFGFYCWEKDENFDIRKHVRFMVKNADTMEAVDSHKVCQDIQEFYDIPIPDDKPQWEILVVPKLRFDNCSKNGKQNYALLFRVHHGIMDGLSAMRAINAGIADFPVKSSLDPFLQRKIPVHITILNYLQMAIFGPRQIFKSCFHKEANCFHGPTITGPKRFGWSKPISLATLKKIKTGTQSSFSSILISSLGGGIKNLCEKKNLPVPHKINIGNTVAMLPYKGLHPSNLFSINEFPVDIVCKSAIDRLRSTNKTSNALSKSTDALLNFKCFGVFGLFPAAVIRLIVDLTSDAITLMCTNLPGADEPYSIFQDPVKAIICYNVVKGNTGIGVVMNSYCGALRAGLFADSAALPDAMDVTNLITAFENEIKELANHVGISEEHVFCGDSR